MQIYVFEDVLCDYTSGMAVIAAESLEQAQAIAFKEFGWHDTIEEFLERGGEGGFQKPAGVYPMPEGTAAGVLHHVYGGG